MKTRILFLSIISLLCISIFGCKKNTITDPPSTNPPTPSSNINYLSKSYQLSNKIRNSSILDTSRWFYYSYDSQKRIINISDSALDLFGGTPTSFGKKTFYYNGTDTLASRINYTGLNSNMGGDTTNTYYQYNAIGQLIIDSTVQSSYDGSNANNIHYIKSKNIRSYSYQGNKVYSTNTYTPLQQINLLIAPYTEKDTLTQDSKGNTIEDKKRKYNTQGQNDYYSIITYMYDNNPSPYKNFSVDGNTGTINKNNILRKIEFIPSTGINNPPITYEIDYSGGYTYNTNGYPTISNFVGLFNVGYFYRRVFIYTTL
jgi:hypothetical protein